MCGIFFEARDNRDETSVASIEERFQKMRHRGPDGSNFITKQINIGGHHFYYGFHRLSIMNPSAGVNQPFGIHNTIAICNGEIYNWRELICEIQVFRHLNINSDCEILPYLYEHCGRNFLEMIKKLDGEFAIILHDLATDTVYAARDFMGMRPLYYGVGNFFELQLASELKAIDGHALHIEPRHIYSWNVGTADIEQYSPYKYWNFPTIDAEQPDLSNIIDNIYMLLQQSVRDRIYADRQIGCLLSGGLDSSIVVSLVSKLIPNIQCFVIGTDDSPDVAAAKKVAEFLKVPLHVVPFDAVSGLEAIPEVISALETYDITTVRASTPQYLLAKWISMNTDIKVILSGEGSYELFKNGYLYTKIFSDPRELHKEGQRLLSELYLFDCLRTDRSMSAFGLEVRVPFLSKELVNYIFSLAPEFFVYSNEPFNGLNRNIEKALLRQVAKKYGLLPDEIIMRSKEAFSDAVGFSWRNEIIEYCDRAAASKATEAETTSMEVSSPEARWYKQIFDKLFPGQSHILPHYWMPKRYGVSDPSAVAIRELDTESS